jgi:hypothetical protein
MFAWSTGLDTDRVVEDVRGRHRRPGTGRGAWGALPEVQAQRMRDVVLDLAEKTATTC